MKTVFLANGKRGITYLALYNGEHVVIKQKNPHSTALQTLANEANWLHILNKKGIGPKFIAHERGNLMMEYIAGVLFEEWLEKQKSEKIIFRVVKDLFEQCYTMDKLQVDKKEMHKPYKHIIVRRNKPIMIDFERCKQTVKPSNVTQFCQYLRKLGFAVKKDNLKVALRKYKKTYDLSAFEEVVSFFF